MANTGIGNMIRRLTNANDDYDYAQTREDMLEALARVKKIAGEIITHAEEREKGVS